MSRPLTLHRWSGTMLVLMLVTLAACALGLSIGPHDLWRAALHGRFGEVEWTILLDIRLVRILVGLLVGGSLACAGAVLQALFRNPLADPFVLGTSGGAAFGAVVGIVFFESTSYLCLPVFAFLGAILAIALVSAGAIGRGALPTQSLLLIGVIANYVFTALVLLITVMSNPMKLPKIEAWLLGDLGGGRLDSRQAAIALVLCAGTCAAMTHSLARPLDALTLGDEQARALGVPVGRVRWTAFLLSSLVTAVAVSISGIVGFVGLILPHALRRFVGADHRVLLPACFLGGGAFLVLADIPARTLFSQELPVGVVTALVGGPMFLWVLRRRRA